jgi:hypothetical protein
MNETLVTHTPLEIDIVNTQDHAEARLDRRYDLGVRSTLHDDEFTFVGEYLHKDHISFLFLANSDRKAGVRDMKGHKTVSFPEDSSSLHHRYCLVKTTYTAATMPEEWSLTLEGKDGNKVTFTRARV